ncbi:MAG: spermine synthase [Clostridiales bacterium]|nr:spermine synthase [Clostridiales bacterium]
MMKSKTIITPLVVLFSLLLITYTLFTFEILVTRLFSAIMWYHFVFIAISLAIFGIGIGGIIVYKKAQKFSQKRADESLYLKLMEKSSLIMAVSIPINTVMVYKVPFGQIMFIPYLVAVAIPFVAAGVFISAAFKQFSGWSHLLYFADLLGSAVGSILVVQLLNHYSILRVALVISLLPLLVFTLLYNFGSKRVKVRKLLSAGIWLLTAIAVISGGSYLDSWSGEFKAYDGNAKAIGMLENPKIIFTVWNAFTRTDVVDVGKANKMYVLLDGSAASFMYRFNGDWDEMKYLRKDPGYIPFIMGENENALLIGPGGGADILLAKLAGIKDIHAVEINPGSILATEYFADYSGNPYNLPGVKKHVMDGRTFTELTSDKYDVIYLSMVMTQASEALGYAMSENYIYTREAFKTYLNKLNPDGKLGLILHNSFDLQKAIVTAIEALKDRGLSRKDAVNSLAVIVEGSEGHSGSIMYPLLIVKEKPFTINESKKLKEVVSSLGQEALFIPGVVEEESLALYRDGKANTMVKPATDDSPFFYNEGLNTVIVLLMLLIIVFVIGRYYFKNVLNKESSVSIYTRYFMLLGIGFMLVEVSLVQKFILFFGHPTAAFSIVIAVILLFGGIGSVLGKFLPLRFKIIFSTSLIALYITLLTLFLSDIFVMWQSHIHLHKIFVAMVVLGPLALVMGIPFPTGLKMVAEKLHEEYVPLMWGVNGWMSVIGSIVAIIVAMVAGFSWSLYMAAVIYLIAGFTFSQKILKSS